MKASAFAAAACGVCFLLWPAAPPEAADGSSSPSVGYEIPWWSVHGGGGSSTGEPFELHAAVGAPASGESAGGSYVLIGGFGVLVTESQGTEIFSDGFESGDVSSWSLVVGDR